MTGLGFVESSNNNNFFNILNAKWQCRPEEGSTWYSEHVLCSSCENHALHFYGNWACDPVGAARDGSCCSRSTRRQRRKVDKCRVADKKQTDKPTNQQTNTHYSFIGIDKLTKVGSDQRSSTLRGWVPGALVEAAREKCVILRPYAFLFIYNNNQKVARPTLNLNDGSLMHPATFIPYLGIVIDQHLLFSPTNCCIALQDFGGTQGLQASGPFVHYWCPSFLFVDASFNLCYSTGACPQSPNAWIRSVTQKSSEICFFVCFLSGF